ncbi:MAG: ABC transporter substrate-binding protein [Chloroflexota bacterium]
MVHWARRAMSVVSTLTLASFVVACSSPAPAPAKPAPATAVPPPTTTAPAAATAAPAAKTDAAAPASAQPVKPKVDRLIMAVQAPGRESNDLRHHGMPDVWELRPMYEYLIGVDPQTGKLIPQLATEWEINPSGPSVRFKLRRGVQFHDGAGEFTAQDVVFSREQLILPDSLHGQKAYYEEVTKQIEIVNDYEVIFHLSRPDANFIRAHSENEGGFEIRSKASFDKNGPPTMQTRPIAGTGPYQYKDRQQGQFIRFERVPWQHWRVTPDFPEFEFRFSKEPSTRMAGLLAGEVHVTSLPEDLLKQAEGRGQKIITATVPGVRNVLHTYGGIVKDWKDPSQGTLDSPLADVRVRKALDKAINRDELNKAFLGGKGESYAPVHYHPKLPGWRPDWQTRFADEYGYDPAAARGILAEAGYGPANPLKTNIILTAVGGLEGYEGDVLESIGEFWRKVGVDVTLDSSDANSIDGQARARAYNNHFRMRNTSSSLYLALWVFYTVSYQGTVQALYPFNPEIDRLFGQLRASLDEQQQQRIYQEIGEIMFTHHTNIPLFWTTAQGIVNPNIVASYTLPGSISGTWTHVEYIKAVPAS